MNYKKIYDSLIDRAKERKINYYTEKHHILPRCLGGLDTKENLVELTAEEHFLAHQLLIKIYPNEPKLVLAARYMTTGNKNNGGRINNKMYGWLKRKFSEAMRALNLGKRQSEDTKNKKSIKMKGRVGKKLSQDTIDKRTATRKEKGSGKGKRRPRTTEEKIKLSKANMGKIPKNKGSKHTEENKKKIKNALAKLPPLTCPHCGKMAKSSVMYRWHFDNCKFIHKHQP